MRFVSNRGVALRRIGRWPFVQCAARSASAVVAIDTFKSLAAAAVMVLIGTWIDAGSMSATAASAESTPITIIAGAPEETSFTIANDLATAFGETSGPRILTVVGRGSLANMSDLTSHQNIDLAITQTDTLEQMKAAGKLGPALNARIGIVAKLHDAELHILAGQNIEKIEDLAGKTVNFTPAGSGTEFTARAVLDQLGIKVRSINVSHEAGLAKVAAGDIAATMLVTGKPARALLGSAMPQGVKLIGIPFPPELDGTYMPATLTQVDYPELVKPGQRIDTLAVSIVLAAAIAVNSDARSVRLAGLVDKLFANVSSLHAPAYHSKWQEANLTVTLPGWSRHPAAESWLSSHRSQNLLTTISTRIPTIADAARQINEATAIDPLEPIDPMVAFAQATRAANGNPAEQERLFKVFLESNKRQPAKTAASTSSQ